jgi:hypothetical protein
MVRSLFGDAIGHERSVCHDKVGTLLITPVMILSPELVLSSVDQKAGRSDAHLRRWNEAAAQLAQELG